MINNLIFDLGFHKGEDAEFYLSKGYNVVAVEANPFLCEEAEIKFKDEIKSGQLILYNKAISSDSKKPIDFFISPTRTEVSSVYKEIAEQDGSTATKVSVRTIMLFQLFGLHGIPDYIKCDVEGVDVEVAKQIYNSVKPKYISFELNKIDYASIFSYLSLSGYNEFQIINQIHNKQHCSGEFGPYLDPNKWLTYDEALSRYTKYRDLKIIDNVNLGVGWVDLHAKL
jgi:FkbM family methyltransferase